MKKQIMTILGLIILFSLISPILAETIILTDLSNEDWNFVAGETIIKEIEVCHNFDEEKELFLTYKIESNEYDLEGLTFSFSENPITFEDCKTIDFNIISQVNYKPDNFTIKIYAITSVSESQDYIAGNTTPIKYEELNVELEIDSTGSGEVEIIRTSYNSKTDLSIPNLGIFIEINADKEIEDNMNEAIIKVYYTQEEIDSTGIDETTLRLYYYNEINQSWEKYDGPDGGVNTDENYVWARITHFSIWGVFGNAEPEPIIIYRGGGTRTKYVDRNITIEKEVEKIVYVNQTEEPEPKPEQKFPMWTLVIGLILVLVYIILMIKFRKKKEKNSEENDRQ